MLILSIEIFLPDVESEPDSIPNNKTPVLNTVPRPIPKEQLKCNILKGN